ncbi:MAG: galactose mutarotase [Clostridia bacterium]|nr:galactose mutarotase [Clostridia bacterium]
MSVQVVLFDTMADGREVQKIVLENKNGTTVSAITYGATLQSLVYRGTDILLGYDKVSGYINANGSFIGASIGRFGNRIGGGKFTLNGEVIQLNCNEASRGCHLHGGNVGFDKRLWDYEVIDGEEPAVAFSLVSPDGEENYPGTMQVKVTYTLSQDDTLSIDYYAVSDKDTVINMTNHAYFNPNGYDGADITNCLLWIGADEITEVDKNLIPTGNFLSLDGSPLDFRTPQTIGKAFNALDEKWAAGGGIDHNFVLSRVHTAKMVDAAMVSSSDTGIRVVCRTTEPGLQIYGGHALAENDGKDGLKWGRFQGFCMETQHFPDSVNHDNFPTTVLRAGEAYISRTEYHVDSLPIDK